MSTTLPSSFELQGKIFTEHIKNWYLGMMITYSRAVTADKAMAVHSIYFSWA